jgi:negative regulator of sigma E activity
LRGCTELPNGQAVDKREITSMAVVFTKARLEWWALVAEIASAAAVVVSVVYLSRQIRDNNKLLRSQAHYNALSLVQ